MFHPSADQTCYNLTPRLYGIRTDRTEKTGSLSKITIKCWVPVQAGKQANSSFFLRRRCQSSTTRAAALELVWRQRFAQGHCTTQIKVALRCFNPVSPDSSKSLLLHTVIGRESYSGISSIFPYCFISLISCTRGRAAESQTSAEWHDTLMNSYWVRSGNRNLACDPSIRWIDRKLQHVWTRTRHGEYTLSAQAEQSVVLSVGTIRWGSSTSSYFLLAVRWELPQSPLPISHFTVSLPWGACVRQQLIAFCGCL